MLDHKSGSKMVQILGDFYNNKIHRVDSSFNEYFKKIFFLAREALISGEERPENLGKWLKTGKRIVMQIREWSILIGNAGLFSLDQSLGITLVFLYVRSNY